MRTRPWLFPAIAALFVLLLGLAALGLLWGTLAGAATAVSDGVVTTDRQFVSPDSTNIASVDRTVGVTLTNWTSTSRCTWAPGRTARPPTSIWTTTANSTATTWSS